MTDNRALVAQRWAETQPAGYHDLLIRATDDQFDVVSLEARLLARDPDDLVVLKEAGPIDGRVFQDWGFRGAA